MNPEERLAFAKEIFTNQSPKDFDEAKRFAIAWIDSALLFSINADYWKGRYDDLYNRAFPVKTLDNEPLDVV